MAKDFYAVLGVARGADEKAIKGAYRKLARQHHPDINPNDKNAEARFKEINEAFQVLSDPEKRKLYDQFGENFDKIPPEYAKYGPQGPSGAGANFPGGFGGNVGGGNINFDEIFSQAARSGNFRPGSAPADQQAGFGDVFENIFGAKGKSGGGVFGRKRGPMKGQDIEQPLEISLAESVKGTQRSLNILIRDESTGTAERRDVTVKIPAGVQDSARVKVAGKGASGNAGGANGDLFLKIRIRPDSFWKREGNDIKIEVPVTFSEAALGATIGVPTLNGEVNLKIPAGTQCGALFRLSGRGVETKSGKGDQYVTVKVTVPKNLSPKEDELIRELIKQRNEDVRETLPRGL